MSADLEIEAMQKMAEVLEPLGEEERSRAIKWAASRFGTSLDSKTPPAANNLVDGPLTNSEYTSFAELFDATDPQVDKEKALVAAYWTQVVQGQENFGSQSLNTALKDLGHGLSNVTVSLTHLIKAKPALALQVQKSGRAQQSRKTYKLTKAGIDRVIEMLGQHSR